MLWLYLELPRLQLDTQAPGEQAHPVAVIDPKLNRVVQLNPPAEKAGVRLNMGLATAATLASQLRVLPYNPALEERRLEELAQALYRLCGDISLDPPQGIWLGASRMVKYHNGLDNYCKSITALISEFGLAYRFGLGYSPLAAQLLSRAGDNRVENDPQRLTRACAHSPLSLTALPCKAQQRLQRLGIQTLGQLLEIPLKALARRFDAEVVQYVGRLTGQLKHPLAYFHPPDPFQRYRELPHELDNTQHLGPWVQQLLCELEAYLRQRDRAVERLELQLHPRATDAEGVRLSVGAARGEERAERWLPLVELALEQCQLCAPVLGLTLKTGPLEEKAPGRLDFFAEQNPADPAALIARLQARLGETRVRGLQALDDHRPEQASRITAPVLDRDRPVGTKGTDDAPEADPPRLRPSFLLTEPQLCREPLELVEGPERIDTGWWDGRAQKRDYYIARNRDGQWCWVFRQPQQEGWFLLGLFA